MPSIKQKEDATQSFIQHFIGPSCTAPGFWIGIWSWLDYQKIPSSDKWGFFLSVRGWRVFVFLRASETERNWTEGPRVFPYGAWDTAGRTPLLPTILTQLHARIQDTLSGLHTTCLPFLRSTNRHTQIRLQKLGVKQPADHNRGRALRRRQQKHERGL